MMIEQLVRNNIKALKPYTCARDMYSSGILLDANENSLGTSCRLFGGLDLNRYPDPHQQDLKKLAGGYFGIAPENLFFGVGSDEIIDLVIRIFAEPGKDKAVILDPTYGMYKVACDINNVGTVSVKLTEDFQIDVPRVLNALDETTKLVFLCSPNNPTGNVINREDILELADKSNSVIVVDEAYMDFSEGKSMMNEVPSHPNIVVLRTFSKAWGLAGIRLGFCVANQLIIDYLFKVKAPYNVSTLTRSAVADAVDNSARKDEFVARLLKERARLSDELALIPGILKVYKSDANYIMIKCAEALTVQKALAARGIIVRDRSSVPMLEGCLRITIGSTEENDKLLKNLKEILCEK